jgi:hypothetical protein
MKNPFNLENKCLLWLSLTLLTGVGYSQKALANQNSVCPGSISIDNTEQVVYDYKHNHSKNLHEFADLPVRPFIVKAGNKLKVMWFASNSHGFCASFGVPVRSGVPDILAQYRKEIDHQTEMCRAWVSSNLNAYPGQYSPDTYDNQLWMVEPYTTNGKDIYALVHNEYHIVPANTKQVYGNLTAATSNDGAKTFTLLKTSDGKGNMPVIAAPFPYNNQVGKSGMFAQTNIIKWGDYYYMLVDQDLSRLAKGTPPDKMCMYRTNNISDYRSWRGWNQETNSYNVPLVPEYPNDLKNPQQYFCSPIPKLPTYFHFTWTYNTVLHKFILIGLDTNYKGSGKSAFVYTFANLSKDGILSSATNKNKGGNYNTYFLRYVNSIPEWKKNHVAGQFYPSMLDPNSPELSDPNAVFPIKAGDLNFQYSGGTAYLYYTRLNPIDKKTNPRGMDRDTVRQQLTISSSCNNASQ